MRRTFLVILAIAGGVVALLFIAVAIAVWRVDPNEFIAPIQARIKQATGRDLAIRGGIDLKLSLTPRLVVHEVELANVPWGSAPQMVVAKELEVEVALLPLLRKRFEVIRVGLVEPSIVLETDAQGHANWDFGGKASGTTSAGGVAASPAAFGVGSVAVTRGKLTYRDGKSGAITNVAIDSLALSARDAQSPVNAEFRGSVGGVAVALTGSLGPLEALVQRQWPYPVALSGEIGGQKANVAAKLRQADNALHIEGIEASLGPNTVKGAMSVVTGGTRPRYTIDLTAAVLTVAQAAAVLGIPSQAVGAGAGAKAGAKSGARDTPAPSAFLFSDAALPLAMLRTLDASGSVRIGRLIVSPRREFDNVDIRFKLQEGHLDLPVFNATTHGGITEAHGKLDVPASGAAVLALTVNARDLDLGVELAAFGVLRDVKGGKTSVKADLRSRGASLHDWAANASGNVIISTGPATITNARLNLDSVFDQLAKAGNPFRETDPTTELKCAVIRLPLVDGVARIDRSVALETQKVGVTVNGTLDLRQETFDLTFKPQLREGVRIELPQVAELIRLHGPMRHPQVSIDAMATVATAARIGAAFGTGGLSEIGVAIFGGAERGGAGPCAVALGGRATGSSPAAAGTPATAPAPDPLGKALGKLFGR